MHRQVHFRASGHQNRLGLFLDAYFAGLGQHISTLGNARQTGFGQGGQVLARQQERAGSVGVFYRRSPRDHGFCRVCRAPDVEPRYEAQACRMLDALMCGAVLAQANGVVREHMHHPQLHQGGHADGVAAVVAKGQERAAKGDEAAMQGHAVHDGGHAEFAHAIVDVAATVGLAVSTDAQRRRGRSLREVGAGQVGAAPEEFGQSHGECF